jgi:hypothetical protein
VLGTQVLSSCQHLKTIKPSFWEKVVSGYRGGDRASGGGEM